MARKKVSVTSLSLRSDVGLTAFKGLLDRCLVLRQLRLVQLVTVLIVVIGLSFRQRPPIWQFSWCPDLELLLLAGLEIRHSPNISTEIDLVEPRIVEYVAASTCCWNDQVTQRLLRGEPIAQLLIDWFLIVLVGAVAIVHSAGLATN